MPPDYRIGSGWDSHEFATGRPLWLGGIRIEHPEGLAGHSDGDVLLHAACDAILGALGAGDIGSHFPSSEPRWKDAASEQFLRHAVELVRERGWRVINLDANLILETPRVGPLRARMQARLAEMLGVEPDRISIKGKTPEGMGTARAAIAQVTVLLGGA